MSAGAAPRRLRIAALGLALFAAALPGLAQAQDFDRRMPKLPPPQPTPTVPEPADAAPQPADATVLIPRLNGVVIVGGLGAVQPDGIAPEAIPDRISAPGLPLLATDAVRGAMASYLDRPLTRADLAALTSLVRETYRTSDHPFVEVSVPPQNVQTGIVQLVVTEYRVGAISVTGNRHYSDKRILAMSDLKSGETLTLPRFRAALEEYNQSPFLTVSGVLKPGAETGVTDVVLEAKDRLPLRVYAGYDNLGVPTLGTDEWYVGFNWGNVLGTGTLLSYQFTRSFEGRYSSHSASGVIPAGPNDHILLFGAYATQKPFVGTALDVHGSSAQVSGRYVHDLGGGIEARESIQVGMDYKRTDNNLEFLGFRILDSAVEIVQFPLVYTGTFSDRGGRWVVENQLIFSPGGITKHNDDASISRLVPGASANYIYNRFSVTRTTYLPAEFGLVMRGMGQFASGNLPFSEQLAGGGLGSVRGYYPNTALGSRGVVLSAELRSPAFNLLSIGPYKDQLQFGLFADYANVSQNRRLPDFPKHSELASVGFNVHYTLDRFLDVQLEVGTQLKRAPFALDRDTRATVIATIAF